MILAIASVGPPRWRWAAAAILTSVCLAVSAGTASGQGFQGTLSALVEDTQGAIVPGASVTLRNQDTAEARSQVSSSTGLVIFPNLLVGRYSVKVEISGFKSAERQNIQARANQQTDVNARLEVGGVEETVVVQAESDLINTRSSQLSGGSFDAKAIIDFRSCRGRTSTAAPSTSPSSPPASELNLAASSDRAVSSAATVPGRTTSSWTVSTTTTRA